MAGVPLYYDPALLRNSLVMKLLVIVWDLLFIEGSSVLLKTIVILIEEMEELISIS
jgi:hypothetical protein